MEDLNKLNTTSLHMLGEYMRIPEYSRLSKKDLANAINRVILNHINGANCTFTTDNFTIAVNDSEITITNPFGNVLSFDISSRARVLTFFEALLRSLTDNRSTSLRIRKNSSELSFYNDTSDMTYIAITQGREPGIGLEQAVFVEEDKFEEFINFVECVIELLNDETA